MPIRSKSNFIPSFLSSWVQEKPVFLAGGEPGSGIRWLDCGGRSTTAKGRFATPRLLTKWLSG
jgi:hypothetical protein